MSHNTHNVLTLPDKEPNPQSSAETWHKVGNSALAFFGEKEPEEPSKENIPEGFGHLFPATHIPAELLFTQTTTAEDAEQLMNKLDDNNPYKDYITSELALHHMQQNDIPRAYSMLHIIKDSGTATHVLSQLFMYEEDHHIETIPLSKLGQELHETAIASYRKDPIAINARALVEASEAMPDDKELRHRAQNAIKEHPEIRRSAEPKDML